MVHAFPAGAAAGCLGGLIGLGGAEFRLPLLIGLFGFAALHAVILNKVMSLVVVAAAIVLRTHAVPLELMFEQMPIVLNLLAGSLVGAWIGAGLATRMRRQALYRVIALLLPVIAFALVAGDWLPGHGEPLLLGPTQWVAGLLAGFGIGVVASLMDVAGGELLTPTLVLLFGIEMKLAGSLSLAVRLPTMLMGFARYSWNRSFQVFAANLRFVWVKVAGSLLVARIGGGGLVGVVPSALLLPLLSALLVISPVKVWQHR